MTNATTNWTESVNSSLFNESTGQDYHSNSERGTAVFAKYEFIQTNPWLAFPIVLFLFGSSVMGTAGNILILLAVLLCKNVRTVESTFIVNLALSDLYVTLVADPFSIVGKLEGEHFFDSVPNLCQTVASMCTVSCISSSMSIAAMSLNRYFYICRQEDYQHVFRQRNCILICLTFYLVGIFLVLLNTAGIGDHAFDRKSLECILDRMATFPYTVMFTVAMVWLPLVITGVCYFRIFSYVRSQRRKIQQNSELSGSIIISHRKQKTQLAKTLFIIYAVFMTCWVPYALLIVIDSHDTFAHQLHVFSTAFAHLHPSLNWLIYYLTNQRFTKAFRYLLSCGKQNLISPDRATGLTEMNRSPPTPPSKIWRN